MVLQQVINSPSTSRVRMRVQKIQRMSQGVNRVCKQIRKEHSELMKDIHDMHMEVIRTALVDEPKGDAKSE